MMVGRCVDESSSGGRPREHTVTFCATPPNARVRWEGRARAAATSYHSIVFRSPAIRPIAFALAVLASLSASGTAIAHAMAHAHVAEDHGGRHAPSPVRLLENGHHGHEHGHVTIDTAPPQRQAPWADFAATTFAIVAPQHSTRVVDVGTRDVRWVPALLPRPGPERGPPFGPRAPPRS